MARESNRLSAVKVAGLRKPGRYGDGRGLWLQVTAEGTKSWLLRYMLHGRARQMGLGPVHTVSLAEARQKAAGYRALLVDGLDPIEARRDRQREARREAARAVSFRACAERYIEAHRPGWRNAKHGDQWTATLTAYAYPVFGELAVADIDTGLVLKAIEPIWTEKPETAKRVRGRIEAILDWAAAREYRAGDNPARWRGHLDKLLPARARVAPVRHHPALPYVEAPDFMAALRAREGVSARALEFTILTAARTGEVIAARWPEIDLGAKVWTVPAERTKARREHRVPLSDRALEILAALPREDGSEYVFIGSGTGRALSNMALLKTLERMGRKDLTVHGFRSTFRDWSAERTNYPREVCEMALAHAISDQVEAAYRRGELYAKRARLMRDWSRYCGGPGGQAKVTAIGQGRAS